MKRTQTKTAALILAVAGTVIPGFGQERGRDNDRSRSGREQGQQRGQYGGARENPSQTGSQPQTRQAPQQDRRGTFGQSSQYQQQRTEARPQSQPQQASPQQASPQQGFRGGGGQSRQRANDGQSNYQQPQQRGS